MRREHLDSLACPRCSLPLGLLAAETADDGHVLEGTLSCARCSTEYPVSRGIPRLLPDPSLRSPLRENTAERFGYEWNQFCDFEFAEEVASLKTWFRPRRLEDVAG